MIGNRIAEHLEKFDKQICRLKGFLRVKDVTEEYETDENIFSITQYPYALDVELENGKHMKYINEDAVRILIIAAVGLEVKEYE